jgi:hypothetical protein
MFSLRIVCIAIMEIACFGLIAMRYERNFRKLRWLWIGAFTLGLVGVCLSLFHPCLSWTPISAALWVTVHDWFSTSYTALSRDAIAATVALIFVLRRVKPTGQGWREMLRAWVKEIACRSAQVGGAVFIVISLYTIGLFMFNLSQSYRIFCTHKPKIELTWEQQKGVFEYIETDNGPAPEDITPEYLEGRREYIVEISYPKTNLIPTSFAVLFQFPYPLDLYKISAKQAQVATFVPRSPGVPLMIGKSGHAHMKMGNRGRHRYWVLQEPSIEPGGSIRIVLVLKHSPLSLGGLLCDGADHLGPPGAPNTALSPMREYIHAMALFSYGKQTGKTESYAPFNQDSDHDLSLGTLIESIPPELGVCSDAF